VGVLAAELSGGPTRRPALGLLRKAVATAVCAASDSVSQVGARRPEMGLQDPD
jgi:hypothetical protein